MIDQPAAYAAVAVARSYLGRATLPPWVCETLREIANEDTLPPGVRRDARHLLDRAASVEVEA